MICVSLILCHHSTDNNSPILDKVFHDIFIRQEFCKLDLIDRLLAAVAFKLRILNPVQNSKMVSPVDGAIMVLLGLNSGMIS